MNVFAANAKTVEKPCGVYQEPYDDAAHYIVTLQHIIESSCTYLDYSAKKHKTHL